MTDQITNNKPACQTGRYQITSRGFTLVELVIVIAMVAVLSLVITGLFIGQNRLYKTQTTELKVNGGARASLDDIDSSVRGANRAAASYTSYIASSQVLILEIQSIDIKDHLIPATYDYVVYYLYNGSLMRQIYPNVFSVRAGGIKKLAENVTGLVFTLDNIDYNLVTEVTTDLTIQEDAGTQNKSITISSKSRMRNN
ncbi:MAG: prepilin-type N-terminal cleavage/methylation domain-containing protein [bacterium]|nr:prepilin-type N-terminal cleavage/methylation domain-containing protein [bacterium]